MKTLITIILIAALCACSASQMNEPWKDSFNQARSSEVAKEAREFIKKRQGCDHFRGEGGYDDERTRFLLQKQKELCTGTDKELRRLKRKYRSDRTTMKALYDFEDCIEYESKCD